MPNIKRLSIEKWMIEMVNQGLYLYPQLNPIIGKDGWYLRDNISWVERKGKAFYYEVQMFKHKLNTLNASEYNQRSINALRSVVKEKLATKKQRDIIYYRDHYEELKRIRRGK